MNGIKIYTHRCGMCDGVENNIKIAQKSLMFGADGFEVGVRLTKNNQLAVIHDEDLFRISYGLEVKKVSEMEFKEIEESLRLSATRIWRLRDFLGLSESFGKTIFIELKNESSYLIEKILKEIKMHPLADVVIISFNKDIIDKVEQQLCLDFFCKSDSSLMSKVKTGLIIEKFHQLLDIKRFLKKYDYVLMGWDPERPYTKDLFKAVFMYAQLIGKFRNIDKKRILVGIADNKKEEDWFIKKGFTKIFVNSIMAAPI